MSLVLLQSGCGAAGPESGGGVHDHRHGHRPGCSGAALHLLHLAQKVRASSSIPHQTQLPCWRRCFLSLSREYDHLKGGLKSSNEMCEKLKREVLTSNNKVVSVDLLIQPEKSQFHACAAAGFVVVFAFFIVVAQSVTGAYKGQRWHEVSADWSDKCRERDLCKGKPVKSNLVSSARKLLVASLAWVSSHRAWRRKWSFFRRLSAHPRAQTRHSVDSSSKGVAPLHRKFVSAMFNFLIFCIFSPAPLDMKQPCLHPPSVNEDIDLNMTYDVTTPDDMGKRPKKVPSKKMHLDSVV